MHRNAKDFIVSTLSNQKQSTCCLRHVCSMSMSMSNEHSALPLIPIDIACTWLDSNRFSCEEGRLIFNWLHQNEWNARKHFENAIKREILLNNPFSVSTISNSLCILFFLIFFSIVFMCTTLAIHSKTLTIIWNDCAAKRLFHLPCVRIWWTCTAR